MESLFTISSSPRIYSYKTIIDFKSMAISFNDDQFENPENWSDGHGKRYHNSSIYP